MRTQLVYREFDEERRIEDKIFEGDSDNDQALDKERDLILGAWKVPSPGFPTMDKVNVYPSKITH